MADKPKIAKRTQKRDFSAHNIYLLIARRELEKAERKETGSFNSAFISITFSALAVEALCNAVGARAIIMWSLNERDTPIDKLKILASNLGVPLNWGKAPWSTIRWLCKLRNDLAHPRPESITHTSRHAIDSASASTAPMPKSKLEKEITARRARNAFEAVSQIQDALCLKLPPNQRFGLFGDAWTTSEEIEAEP